MLSKRKNKMIEFTGNKFIDDKDKIMREDENKFALKFTYQVKMAEGQNQKKENGENNFNEFFIPYSYHILRENGLISVDEEKILTLCSKDSAEKTIESVTTSLSEIKETDWKNENGIYEETCAFDYVADFVFVTELLKLEKKNERRIIKHGVLSELIKCKFSQFKIDFSILYIIFNDKKFEENFKKNKSLYITVIYNTAKRNFSRKTLTEKQFNMKNIRENLEKDWRKFFEEFIKSLYENAQEDLLEIYKNNVDSNYLSTVVSDIKNSGRNKKIKKYKANDTGCFCVVENCEKIYFSLSGIKDADYCQKHTQNAFFELIDKIKNTLKAQFTKNIVYCNFSFKVKAYGIKTEHSFVSFPEPISCNQYPSFMFNYVYPVCISDFHGICGELYGCCERKIFVETQNEYDIKIHCRWAPCVKCEKAVFEEINRHSNFDYIALSKDFNEFQNYVFNGEISKMKLWKLTKV